MKKVQLTSRSTQKYNRDLVVVLECIATGRLVALACVITEEKLTNEGGILVQILKNLFPT